MKSTYKVLWSKRAYNNLARIILYLEKEWSEKETKKFSKKLASCINILEKTPEAFPASEDKPGLRRVVLTKHNILYYKIENKVVKLSNIFDSRQNPKKKNE